MKEVKPKERASHGPRGEVVLTIDDDDGHHLHQLRGLAPLALPQILVRVSP